VHLIPKICLLLSAFCVLYACGGPDLSNQNANAPIPKATPPVSELEMSGVYNVTGAGDNDTDPYQGILTITNREDAYIFKWNTNRSRPGGVGVQSGDAVAVTYADQTNGQGCGVALYKIAPDGSLDGKIAMWGEYKFGTEKATRVAGDNFDAKYNVSGTTGDGKPYEGTIDVEKHGEGYLFKWRIGRESAGFGIWRGDRAAIGFGGKQCSFALYKVMSARSLEGHWGSPRKLAFGRETAKRQ